MAVGDKAVGILVVRWVSTSACFFCFFSGRVEVLLLQWALKSPPERGTGGVIVGFYRR